MKQETITTICNKALSLIGEEPISSYDNDTSLPARACRSHFDLVMASLLEEGFWTFPTVEVKLEKVVEETEEEIDGETVTTVTDLKYQDYFMYEIPAHCVLIHSIYGKGQRHNENHPLEWDIRYIPEETKRYIICPVNSDEHELYCEYLFSPDNLEIYSASFIKALVDGLAYSICMEITKDMQRTQFLLQLYEKDKADALRKCMNEDLSEHEYTSPFITCRG